MTRKHFAAIAATIAKAPITHEARAVIAAALAIDLKATNPAFDKARFLRACGV